VRDYASTDRCACCGVPYDGFARYPFCDRCFSGRCKRCASRVQESLRGSLILNGRPPGPKMLCGWRCGAWLSAHQMRAHFTICPKRPTNTESAHRIWPPSAASLGLATGKPVRSKPRRGRPPGLRMQCGWHCGAKLTASQMRKHFTNCPRRPPL